MERRAFNLEGNSDLRECLFLLPNILFIKDRLLVNLISLPKH